MRFKHYSLRTERTYQEWIKRYIFFHTKRHPREMGAFEVERFLSDLATARKVAASTQNQAFNALLFLYREVLHQELGELGQVERAKRPERLPVVLTRDRVIPAAGLSRKRDWVFAARWMSQEMGRSLPNWLGQVTLAAHRPDSRPGDEIPVLTFGAGTAFQDRHEDS
jgi:integrase